MASVLIFSPTGRGTEEEELLDLLDLEELVAEETGSEEMDSEETDSEETEEGAWELGSEETEEGASELGSEDEDAGVCEEVDPPQLANSKKASDEKANTAF